MQEELLVVRVDQAIDLLLVGLGAESDGREALGLAARAVDTMMVNAEVSQRVAQAALEVAETCR